MRKLIFLFFCSLVLRTVNAQESTYPGTFDFKSYRIGQRIDTSSFTKFKELYFPNHLDGWNYDNITRLPKKYEGLPIAIWQSKSDSSVALTLLEDRILNIIISFLSESEKSEIVQELNTRFHSKMKFDSYEQEHPLQSWITYWNLETWETRNVIVQIGNSDMRMPNQPEPEEKSWNLVYSDFKIESQIIEEYKNRN